MDFNSRRRFAVVFKCTPILSSRIASSEWVDLLMTQGALSHRAVLRQLIADVQGSANVRLDGRHHQVRRELQRLSHDPVVQPRPRSTGDVTVPLAVTLSTAAIVSTPPRWLSPGSFTLRNSGPSTPSIP